MFPFIRKVTWFSTILAQSRRTRVVISSEMGTVVLEDVDQGQGTQDVGGSWR